jgi:lysophospholipid acyltransferase (LPLAT)-like uncharacterized protein
VEGWLVLQDEIEFLSWAGLGYGPLGAWRDSGSAFSMRKKKVEANLSIPIDCNRVAHELAALGCECVKGSEASMSSLLGHINIIVESMSNTMLPNPKKKKRLLRS